MVYVTIIGQQLVLLKEHWEHWKFFPNSDVMKRVLKNKASMETIEKATYNRQTPGGINTPGGSYYTHEDIKYLKKVTDGNQKAMMERCLASKCDLFSIVTVIEIKDINKLNIHKGKDPSVELLCFNKKKNSQQYNHNIKLLFPGDMERQRFVETIIALKDKIKNGHTSDTDDKDEQDWEEDENDEDSERENNESDEEPQMAIIYD